MGNLSSCFSATKAPRSSKRKRGKFNGSLFTAQVPGNEWSRSRSSRKDSAEDALIQEQAMAAAILFRQHQQQQLRQQNSSALPPFDRSTSVRQPYGFSGSKKIQLPRSSSSRPRTLTDPLLQPQQLVNQDIRLDDLETNHFVLVHGGGFGAWCWYKTIALLEEGGYRVSAIDLAGSGVDISDPNCVTSLSQYAKPLVDFIEKLPDEEKVILVGHDFGGACLSFTMELFPQKISRSIFIAAAMVANGQSALDIFSHQTDSNSLMQQAQAFNYAKGSGHPPTSINLKRSMLKELLFSQCPTRDVALASVSMREIPFAPVLEKLRLSDAKYGSVRRFYIQATEDNAVHLSVQEHMVASTPPEKVFRLKGSDHSPFLSKPQALHKLLVEISKIPTP